MPSGDAQRIWFPEMIEDLKTKWTPSTTWEEFVDLCRFLTEKRKRIRHARGILPPRMQCPSCGEITSSDIQGVSIRSALFTLKKIEMVSEAVFKDFDRDWKNFQRKNNLDAYGNKKSP